MSMYLVNPFPPACVCSPTHPRVVQGALSIAVLQAEGVPFVFSAFTYLGPGSDYEADKHLSVPWTQSLPPGDAVLEFTVKNK